MPPPALPKSTLTLAMADTLDFETVAAVRAFSGLQIQTVRAAEQEILDAKRQALRRIRTADAALVGEGDNEQATTDLEHLGDMASEAPVPRLVNALSPRLSKSALATSTSSRSRRSFAYGSA
jgi:general secretion pathway protein E